MMFSSHSQWLAIYFDDVPIFIAIHWGISQRTVFDHRIPSGASKTHALVHLESHENTGGEVGALAASDWNWNFRNLTMDNAHSYIYIY